MSVVAEPLVIHTNPDFEMDDEQFFHFCAANPELRIEREADGNILIMTPEGAPSGIGSSKLTHWFENWAEQNGQGTVFGPSAGFRLPNGATRSPDISWVLNDRIDEISDADWQRFLPLCPDFVLELRSPSDRLRKLKEKMEEYMANGARLGWLLDPEGPDVYLYRPGEEVTVMHDPDFVTGEPVLPGFQLDVKALWNAMQRRRKA